MSDAEQPSWLPIRISLALALVGIAEHQSPLFDGSRSEVDIESKYFFTVVSNG